MKRLRVLALVHQGFAPPAGATAEQARAADWRADTTTSWKPFFRV